MNKSLIKVEDVSVIYQGEKGETEAIKDVSLNIYKGDFISLLGPSGCGKSTLLNLIAGFNMPSQGSVSINGNKVLGPGPDRGVVFQSTNLFPWLNVEENISYGLTIKGWSREESEKKISPFLKQVGLLDYRKHYPFELSGGMQQRVALIRTLVNDPEIVLMDEPFGALDAITRSKMQSMVRKLWLSGNQTYLTITHDIDEALILGNRVVVMSSSPGRVIKTYDLDFYKKIEEDSNYIAGLDPKYIKIKTELLNLIADK